jgi:threonine dehydrogenase-like Zn-dependent dehydrogenase
MLAENESRSCSGVRYVLTFGDHYIQEDDPAGHRRPGSATHRTPGHDTPDTGARRAGHRGATRGFGIDAIKTVRRGGTVSVTGVYGGAVDPMPMLEIFDKGNQLRMGQCHVKRWIGDIMPLLLDDTDPLGTESSVTHHLPLDQAPHGYEIFQKTAARFALRP